MQDDTRSKAQSEGGSIWRPVLVVLFLALPAAALKVMSNFSDNPYLQPLNITMDGVEAYEISRGARAPMRVDVEIAWGRDYPGGMRPDTLQRVIANSLESQTSKYRFEMQDRAGADIRVSFVVGSNRYGPYPPGAMEDGLSMALSALQMSE